MRVEALIFTLTPMALLLVALWWVWSRVFEALAVIQ